MIVLIIETAIAREAYIYFYSVQNVTKLYFQSIWPQSDLLYNPLNKLLRSPLLMTWRSKGKTDPSVDVLYSEAWLDLENPIVLNIPEFPKQVCANLADHYRDIQV